MAVASSTEKHQRWSEWTSFALQKLPLPYAGTVILIGVFIMVTEQAVEHWLGGFGVAGATMSNLLRRSSLPVLTIYMLAMLSIMKRTAVSSLTDLRPAVLIGDPEYETFVRRMVHTGWRAELLLFVATLAIELLLFVVLDQALPIVGSVYLPQNPFLALFILGAYTLQGWIGLILIYSTLRFGYALGRLAGRPLDINVFDSANLVPFGRLALIHSLSPAGVILILISTLGRPTGPLGYSVTLLASLASLVALVVPLWGVHQQMDEAQEKALAQIHSELKRLHRALFDSERPDTKALTDIANRTGTLVNLRKLILESPTWPFRDAATTARALIAATSPLIYFVLTELIRTYLLPLVN